MKNLTLSAPAPSTGAAVGIPTYEVFAIRYADRASRRRNAFQGGDPHDGPLGMDYFVWVIRNEERTFVVDMGFSAEVAARRQRNLIRLPREGLAMIGVDTLAASDVIVTHMHFDHVGTYRDFPVARFHLQESEMEYATGKYMQYGSLKQAYEVDDVMGMVRLVYEGRVQFHSGVTELAPGVSIHRIGGHTKGCQCVRIHTARGWIVLASDCSHYYENFETNRFYSNLFNVGEQGDGFATMRGLADSPQHIIPGHDPLVMKRYSAPAPALRGVVVRLDVPPEE
jgi:glyoxylase-like metal-dependent hydrolase (beta-lactamase superfamily II)